MFRSRLQAEGISAFVAHEYHIGNAWHYSTALGGVKVQVSEEQKDDAKSIENRCRRGEFRSLLESECGPMDEIQCPNCGSHEYWKRRPLVRAALAIILSARFGTIVPPIGWVYFCIRCGNKFAQPLYPNKFDRWAVILVAIACDLALLVALALCVWALQSRYWFAAVLILILGAALTHSRLSQSNSNEVQGEEEKYRTNVD